MKLKYNVTGMTCAACSARVEKVVRSVDGVINAEVNLLSGKLTVDAQSDSVSPLIEVAVQNSGYGISAEGKRSDSKEEKDAQLKSVKKRIIWSALFLLTLMYFTMGHMVGLPVPHWYHGRENAVVAALVQLMLTLPVVYLNSSYYAKGFK